MTDKNAFGQEIPCMWEILSDDSLRNYIERTLATVLEHLGAENSERAAGRIVELNARRNRRGYELLAHNSLQDSGVSEEQVTEALSGRAELVYRQIRPFVRGSRVLDLGCGDGNIGARVAQDGHKVTLADVYRNSNIDTLGLEFIEFGQGQELPDKKKYDTALLLTVLHHSDDPIKTLETAIERTKDDGRIIVIESVYGVGPHIRDPTWSHTSRQLTDDFKRLSPEQQRRSNIFFDHFYNRVVHYTSNPINKVNTPFNFRQPLLQVDPIELLDEGWANIFYRAGLKPVGRFEYLGIDQPAVPEYHTLHVLEKF